MRSGGGSVVFFTLGSNSPAGRFRVTQYIPYLEKAGWNCILWPACPAIEYSRLDIFNFKYGRYINSLVKTLFSIILTVWRILQVGRYDVVFLQRRLPNIVG